MSGSTGNVPAIGYSVIANLPGDRQVTAQCFVGEDETDDVINAKFDRIFRVIDRQKARYEVFDLRQELHDHKEKLAQLEEDLARADTEFERAQASLDVQATEISDQRKAGHDAEYDRHVESGRRGNFELRGAPLQRDKAHAVALEQVRVQKEKNAAERDQHRQQILITIQRYQSAIATIEGKIGDREALSTPPTG